MSIQISLNIRYMKYVTENQRYILPLMSSIRHCMRTAVFVGSLLVVTVVLDSITEICFIH